MKTKIQNKENMKKILELAHNMIKLSQYIKNKEIINWIKQDISEIYLIHKDLKTKKQLEVAYEIKDLVNIQIDGKASVENKILMIYNVINRELNSWRKVNLEINI